MNLLNLAEIYIKTARPSHLKEQGITDVFGAMLMLRRKLDISERSKIVAVNRYKNLKKGKK